MNLIIQKFFLVVKCYDILGTMIPVDQIYFTVRESLQLRKWPCALQLLASATGHQMQVSSMAYSAAVNACSVAKGRRRWPWIATLPGTKTSENGGWKTSMTSFLLGLFQGVCLFPEM